MCVCVRSYNFFPSCVFYIFFFVFRFFVCRRNHKSDDDDEKRNEKNGGMIRSFKHFWMASLCGCVSVCS